MSLRPRFLILALTSAICLAVLPTQASAAGTGSISGTVTGGATEGTLLLAGPCVAAYDSSGTQVGYQRADSDGHYTIGNLETGDYRLEIIDCSARVGPSRLPEPPPGLGSCVGAAVMWCLLPGLPSEFYDNERTLAEATPVPVADGVATTGIDARLGTDGGISGTVTDDSGTPLEGICVEAFYRDGNPAGVAGRTTSAGQYQVNNLGAGLYDLKFSDCLHPEDPAVITEFYGDQPTASAGEPVAVTEDIITTGIDAQLATPTPPVEPEPRVHEAAISKVSVQGPAKVKKGKKVTFAVKISNFGDTVASGVKLGVKGRGATFGTTVGSIEPGATKSAKVKLKPKKAGKVKLTFKVTSANAGGKNIVRRITVKK